MDPETPSTPSSPILDILRFVISNIGYLKVCFRIETIRMEILPVRFLIVTYTSVILVFLCCTN